MELGTVAAWVGVAIAVLTMLGGTAINLFILGRFVGRYTEAQNNFTTLIARIEQRVEDVEAKAEEEREGRGVLMLRVQKSEDASHVLWEVRDKVTSFVAAREVEDKHQNEKLDSALRSIAGLERQVATIAKEGLQYRPPRMPMDDDHGPVAPRRRGR